MPLPGAKVQATQGVGLGHRPGRLHVCGWSAIKETLLSGGAQVCPQLSLPGSWVVMQTEVDPVATPAPSHWEGPWAP